jgi:hypothetical protein
MTPPFDLPDPSGLPSTRVGTRPRDPSDQVAELKADVERLLLVTEALWKIVQEKHGLEDKELLRQITMLDMTDGKLDARKPKSAPRLCPKCNRALGKRKPKCMFCGEPVRYDPFER